MNIVHIDISQGEATGKYQPLADAIKMGDLSKKSIRKIQGFGLSVIDSRMYLLCKSEDQMGCYFTFIVSSELKVDHVTQFAVFMDDWREHVDLIDASWDFRTMDKLNNREDDHRYYFRFLVRWHADY